MNLWSLLQKNQALRKAHAGKRAFIIANGPSLAQQDLRRLRDEVTIVVNSFYLHPHLNEIQPKYWVIADPLYWTSPEQYLLPIINGIRSHELNTRLVMPSGAIPLMSQLNFGPAIEPYFFHYDFDHQDPVKTVDFTTGVPPFGQTVVIPALMLAYFLGCDPIYLLGCDHDWFSWTADTYGAAEFPHFYQPDGKKEAGSAHQELYDFNEISRIVRVMKHQYSRLLEYGEAKGFKVYNATAGGYLDIFPRVDYSSLVARGEPAFPEERFLDSLLMDAQQLAMAAIRLIQASDPTGALVLLEKATEANVDRYARVAGLEYLKASCLARMGFGVQAIHLASQEVVNNPANKVHAQQLIDALQGGEGTFPEISPENLGSVDGAKTLARELRMEWVRQHVAEGERRFAEEEDLAGALREFLAALDLDPDQAPTHNNLGVLYWQVGLRERALEHFERARALDPENSDTLANCEEAYRALGRVDDLTASPDEQGVATVLNQESTPR